MKTWVVGGTSGIGKAIVEALPGPTFVSGADADVRYDSLIEIFLSKHGPFEAIVYSAGISQLDWMQNIEPGVMLDTFDVNCVGLIRVLQHCPQAKRVVVIGSDAAWRPMRTSIMYNASKAALHETVRCIAREWASENFAINVVAPGLVDTPMTEYVYNRTYEIRPEFLNLQEPGLEHYMLSQIPLGRTARPEEIAEVVRAVLEIETPYLNGAIIPVNGAR